MKRTKKLLNNMRWLFNIFRFLLFLVVITCTILSVFAIIFVLWKNFQLQFSLSEEGLNTFISSFEQYKLLLAATFIVIPAYIALESYISDLNIQEGQILVDLRKLLCEDENLEVHKKLRGNSGAWSNGIPNSEKDNPETYRKIDNYLGIIELINILINNGTLKLENYKNQFGYRITNIYSNDDIMEYINQDAEEAWIDLLNIIKKQKKIDKKRKL